MDTLKKILTTETEKIPRLFLQRVIKKKLKEQGVEDKRAIEALTTHVLSGEEGAFEWDDGDDSPEKTISIDFTDQDSEEFSEAVNKFLTEDLPNIVDDSVKDGAKSLVKELNKRWPEVKLDSKYASRQFSDRMDLVWSKGLDPLRMMLIASQEIGEAFSEKLTRSKAKKGRMKREALMILHRRACQTTLEILTLIENGLPDGAYARWRTLYELTVVAFFISRFGDEVARRYMAHDVVSARELLVNEFKFAGELYDPKSLVGEAIEIEDDFVAVINEFGKSFAGHYGWAADSLGKKSPRFQDLEEAVEWRALPPEYKWSSFKIHAGSAGALRTLSSVGGRTIIHSGATNAGLEIPAMATASSLLQITSLVFPNPKHMDTVVQGRALMLLRDKVVRECQKAARKLEKDELKFRKGLDE